MRQTERAKQTHCTLRLAAVLEAYGESASALELLRPRCWSAKRADACSVLAVVANHSATRPFGERDDELVLEAAHARAAAVGAHGDAMEHDDDDPTSPPFGGPSIGVFLLRSAHRTYVETEAPVLCRSLLAVWRLEPTLAEARRAQFRAFLHTTV